MIRGRKTLKRRPPLAEAWNRTRTVRGRKFLFRVETSEDAEDYRKYEDLRQEIWGFPEDSLPGTRNMLCENFLQDGSSLFLAVYAAERGGKVEVDPEHCVGFSYGFVGLKDKSRGFGSPDNLWFYSQYTGVRPEVRSFGLGVMIKEFQRQVLMDTFGLTTVVCTFDPLTGVNARRNVHHFGMEVVEYRVAVYGEFGGRLNRRDVPSDRFFMSWDLRRGRPARPAVKPDLLRSRASRLFQVEKREIAGRSGRIKLEVVRSVDPTARGRLVLVPVPADFYRMLRETDVEDEDVRRIPLDWRLKTREAFQALLDEGYRIVDFERMHGVGAYVLERGRAGRTEPREGGSPKRL
jgi:predicted GNAT superfamily acetyltransferase